MTGKSSSPGSPLLKPRGHRLVHSCIARILGRCTGRAPSVLHTLFRLCAVIAAVLLAAFSVFLTKRAPEELPAA